MKRVDGLADAVPRDHFPENQLGASLKLAVAVLAGEAELDFPENQLGASLKPGACEFPLLERYSHFPENQLGPGVRRAGS